MQLFSKICKPWSVSWILQNSFFFPDLTVLSISVNPNFLSYTKPLAGFTACVQQVWHTAANVQLHHTTSSNSKCAWAKTLPLCSHWSWPAEKAVFSSSLVNTHVLRSKMKSMVECATETRISLTVITYQILFQQFDLVLCSPYGDAATFYVIEYWSPRTDWQSYAFWYTSSVMHEISSLFVLSFFLVNNALAF